MWDVKSIFQCWRKNASRSFVCRLSDDAMDGWMRGCSKNEALSHPPHLQQGGRKVAAVTGCLCPGGGDSEIKKPLSLPPEDGRRFPPRAPSPFLLLVYCSKRDTSADKGEEDAAASEKQGQLSRRNRSLITPLTKPALTTPPASSFLLKAGGERDSDDATRCSFSLSLSQRSLLFLSS